MHYEAIRNLAEGAGFEPARLLTYPLSRRTLLVRVDVFSPCCELCKLLNMVWSVQTPPITSKLSSWYPIGTRITANACSEKPVFACVCAFRQLKANLNH